ncbi:MAG: cyclopropane-fatty-acyl-phospholipid synthase family protein [Pirellulaceae bacterium]
MSSLPASCETLPGDDSGGLTAPPAMHAALASALGGNWLERACRRMVHRQLEQLEHGRLLIVEDDKTTRFGRRGSLTATIRVHDPRFYRRLVTDGWRDACEAYVDGDCSSPDLPAVVRVMARNRPLLASMAGRASRLLRAAHLANHWLRRNSRSGSRRNISAHYDLGNDFFALFLDRTMTYSCGVFERPGSTLEEASLAKYERVCRKLQLRKSDHVLEVGGGWGGFAVYAAENVGCRVTTTTISQEQFDFARQRVEQAGLGDRVDILQKDYRDLEGQYDKLVSIEMIEAVGHAYLDTYFAACCRLLKPDGMMLLQGITIPDDRFARYLHDVDFIKRHVFPGGDLPSLSSIAGSLHRATDFRALHVEDLTPHYARTLACWRDRFWRRIGEVRRLGFDERFVRLWDLYLAYCEGGFEERQIGVAQYLLARPENRRESVLGELAEACS